MLMPKKVKYRKQHRGRMAGKAWRGSSVSFGDYGLKALEPCWMTDRQIEAARVAMTRFIKRGGKIWVRVFPDKPITKKPQETRMGKGKGAPEQWVAVVRPGRILFEMEGVSAADAERAMTLAAAKLPIGTRFTTRFGEAGGRGLFSPWGVCGERTFWRGGSGLSTTRCSGCDSSGRPARPRRRTRCAICAGTALESRRCCASGSWPPRGIAMGKPREVGGIVVRDKMDRGVVVAVERRVSHDVYGKIQRRTSRFMAHDEANTAKVGDRIAMVESRPLSRRKRYVVTRVIERAGMV